jgi:DNA-binding transcriptional LysR family regulator
MDVRQLETFLWIARLGSVTQACKRLNVTQSTLSMRLRALETDLRVQLFERAHKRLTLTAKGRDLVRYAERILGTVEQVRLFVADPKSESGTLRVGVAELIALTWLPELLRRLRTQFPNVVLDLDVGIPRPMMDGLAGGKLDVVLAPVVSKPTAPFLGFRLGSVRYSWMASPELKLQEKVVTPVQLERHPIIGIASNQSVFYSEVEQWFASHGAAIQRLNICNSLGTSAAMAMAGIGVSLLPHAYFAPLVRAGKLEVLRTDRTFEFEWYSMCRALTDQALPKMVAELAQSASSFRGAWANPSRALTRRSELPRASGSR